VTRFKARMLMSSSLRDPADAAAAWRAPPASASTIDASAPSAAPDDADDQDSEQGARD
jgi:hypothetical protein